MAGRLYERLDLRNLHRKPTRRAKPRPDARRHSPQQYKMVEENVLPLKLNESYFESRSEPSKALSIWSCIFVTPGTLFLPS